MAVVEAQVLHAHQFVELYEQLQVQEEGGLEEEGEIQVEVEGEGEETLRTTTSWMTAWME